MVDLLAGGQRHTHMVADRKRVRPADQGRGATSRARRDSSTREAVPCRSSRRDLLAKHVYNGLQLPEEQKDLVVEVGLDVVVDLLATPSHVGVSLPAIGDTVARPDPASMRSVEVQAFESTSSWEQPTPAPASAVRTQLLDDLAHRLVGLRSTRVRAVVDGYTASGKTSFAHELAAAVRSHGRPTMRATFDDFKKPWRDAREKGYDRVSGEGFYRNAPDFETARELLLKPAGPEGSGVVALCGHDPLTGEDHRGTTVDAPPDSVLIVDSVFGMRPEYDSYWDFRIWIEVPPQVALDRGIERDSAREGRDQAERLHRDRYCVAVQIYVNEVDPKAKADVVIDNTDFRDPVVIRW